MAHPDNISPDLLVAVARHIGDLIDKNVATGAAGLAIAEMEVADQDATTFQLGETLTVWKLRTEAFEALANGRLIGDLSDWIERTSLLYHQIRSNGSPDGFARSYTEGDAPLVLNVNASTIASKVDQLLRMIEDQNQAEPFFAADPIVRLLEIPASRIFALWLFAEANHESRVLIINATEGEVKNEAFLTSAQFFEVLGNYRPVRDVA